MSDWWDSWLCLLCRGVRNDHFKNDQSWIYKWRLVILIRPIGIDKRSWARFLRDCVPDKLLWMWDTLVIVKIWDFISARYFFWKNSIRVNLVKVAARISGSFSEFWRVQLKIVWLEKLWRVRRELKQRYGCLWNNYIVWLHQW